MARKEQEGNQEHWMRKWSVGQSRPILVKLPNLVEKHSFARRFALEKMLLYCCAVDFAHGILGPDKTAAKERVFKNVVIWMYILVNIWLYLHRLAQTWSCVAHVFIEPGVSSCCKARLLFVDESPRCRRPPLWRCNPVVSQWAPFPLDSICRCIVNYEYCEYEDVLWYALLCYDGLSKEV